MKKSNSFFKFFFAKNKNTGTVKYKLKGTPDGFNITYKNKEGKTIQNSNVTNGWSYKFNGTAGDYVYFSAQANKKKAVVTVKILFKRKIFKEVTSSGDYALAIVSGILR